MAELDCIIKRFGQWAVTTYGIEAVDGSYWIEAERLWEVDWLRHMGEKTWVNYHDFTAALLAAREIHASLRAQTQTPKRTRYIIMRRDGFRCQLCGRSATDGVKLEIDHKHPQSQGGSDDEENLWTLCDDCNQGKCDLALEIGQDVPRKRRTLSGTKTKKAKS